MVTAVADVLAVNGRMNDLLSRRTIVDLVADVLCSGDGGGDAPAIAVVHELHDSRAAASRLASSEKWRKYSCSWGQG